MNVIRNLLAASFVSAIVALVPSLALAQATPTRPSSNPTYIPTGQAQPQTLSAAGPTPSFYLQGEATIVARLAGSPVGLVGTFQGTNDPGGTASPTWTNIGTEPIGVPAPGGAVTVISTTGLYRLNVAGLTRVRFNATTLTSGSVAVTLSSIPAAGRIDTALLRRGTYAAYAFGLTPATGLTDLMTLTGSASTTVRVYYAECDGTATADGVGILRAVVRSTADTGGTSAAVTPAQMDGTDAAPTAVATTYSANPTLGTTVANAGGGVIALSAPATSPIATAKWRAIFGTPSSMDAEPLTLRGATQELAINGNATSLPSGASLNCGIVWSEE